MPVSAASAIAKAAIIRLTTARKESALKRNIPLVSCLFSDLIFRPSQGCSLARSIALRRPFLGRLRDIIGKLSRRYGSPRPRHQVLVVEQINDRQQRTAKRFAGFEQVMQIGTREIARGRAAALGIERARIAGVLRILDVDGAETGESKAVAAVAGRQDAIEHVDAAANG